MIGSCRRSEILSILKLNPENYSVGLVLALGKPKEEVRLVPVGDDGSTTYYRMKIRCIMFPRRKSGGCCWFDFLRFTEMNSAFDIFI